MKWLLGLSSLIFIAGCGTPASVSDASCSDIAQMHGTWDVALLFDISKPPSSTKMIITGDGNDNISGSFYESPFESSEMTAISGFYIIASATSDGTGEYVHTARYSCVDDNFEGQTWSRGRNFLMSWTAERSDG